MSREEEMSVHVSRWKESGLSIGGYCLKEGLTYNSLRYWIKKINAKAGSDPVIAKKDMFIELGSSSKEDFKGNASTFYNQSVSQPQVELTFPSGLCLKIYG